MTVYKLKFMANAVKIYTATEEDFYKLQKMLIEKIEAKKDKFDRMSRFECYTRTYQGRT